ncbi:MAG: acyl-CoA synthetase [Burkholderiaceae bacterium]|nr:acyl-CoA synthetase [Burkholderiaceae bacterium]
MSTVHPAQVCNLARLLSHTARLFPERTALIQGEQRWTWRELDQRVDALVAALTALGVQRGDRILQQSRNNLALFEAGWAAFRMGCVWVPTNFRLAPSEVAYLGESSGAVVMLAETVFAEHVAATRAAAPALRQVLWIGDGIPDGEPGYEALVQQHLGAAPAEATVAYDDPLWFFYTSGTTGKPKAGILTHGQMNFVVANHLADLIPGTDERDVSIAVAPLSHGAGIHALLNVARGAATVLLPGEKMDAGLVWQLVERHRVSNLFTVPTIVKLLVEHPAVDQHDHSSLRYLIYAGAPMYRADQRLALQKLGPVLVQYFGLGEVTGCITVLPAHMHSADDASPDANIGSCGRPRTGMEVAVLDADMQPVPTGEIGEICVRGGAVFAGYHANAEATAKALRGGWFHTGDLGRLDPRGLLYITGRESDMYISGGSNVYPRECEEVLLSHPGVAEVAVLGVPDRSWGEIGVAVVVRREPPPEGLPPVDADTLLAWLDGRLARYRWPRQFFFWDALPKSGYGKITKKDVRALLFERGEVLPVHAD